MSDAGAEGRDARYFLDGLSLLQMLVLSSIGGLSVSVVVLAICRTWIGWKGILIVWWYVLLPLGTTNGLFLLDDFHYSKSLFRNSSYASIGTVTQIHER